MNSEEPKLEKNVNVHYAPFVPDLVADDDKTTDAAKVTCEACRETLLECDEG